MTTSNDHPLARRLRAWQIGYQLDWPKLFEREEHWPAGQEYTAYEGTIDGVAIAAGSKPGVELGKLLPFLEADLVVLEREAGAGQISWAWMGLVDQIGVFGAMGASGIEPLLGRAATCLPSIQTSRDGDLPFLHWNRGLAALVFDLPIYRPISGHDIRDTLRFVPGATFGLDVQGFLAHLAGAAEQGAELAACEPAWRNMLVQFPVLERAKLLGSSSLVWMAIVLHHKIGKQPLATTADYLHASVIGAVAAGG